MPAATQAKTGAGTGIAPGVPVAAVRVRMALLFVSMAALALELSLMRILALRFWHHVAYLVISVALLGFGASGTALTFLRGRIAARRQAWLAGLAAAFALATAVGARLATRLPLDVQFLAWDPRQVLGILVLEALVLLPFLFAGAFVGAALMDRPERVSGHYAANLFGSGLGAVVAVALMHRLSPERLLGLVAALAFLAAAILAPWRNRRAAALLLSGAAALVLLEAAAPLEPAFSAYKRIAFEQAAGARLLHEAHGPMGRVAVIDGPAVHEHPGLGWQYTGPIPPHALILIDGDQASAVYDAPERDDWAFMDHTTAAAAYALHARPDVALVGAGGGAGIGLARYHRAPSVTALESNREVIAAMRGPLRERGGGIVDAPGVTLLRREARGHFAGDGPGYDIIQVPPMSGFGAAGAGLIATQDAYLHTVESFGRMLDRLQPGGTLAITVWMQDPPRAGLRAFETLAEALRRRRADPAACLAMIRSRTTVTVLARPDGLRAGDGNTLRAFAEARGFDLATLPGLRADETNRFHVLSRPAYFEATQALLGPEREAFLRAYLFAVDAPTDDRPFFFNTFRWRRFGELRRQLGGRVRAFLEPGVLMLLAAFAQTVVLAALLILAPLASRRGVLRGRPGRGAVLGFFLALGLGFMTLEMALLGRLILYLAHPIYAASVAVASFLVFAGLGSRLSARWRLPETRLLRRAAVTTAALGAVYAVGLGRWLAWSRGAPMGVRLVIAVATVAPLAVSMGHLFPTALRQVGRAAPPLIPWAWAVNGFASVFAAVGTPLLAMHIGYTRVGLVAAAAYAAAATLASRLPRAAP